MFVQCGVCAFWCLVCLFMCVCVCVHLCLRCGCSCDAWVWVCVGVFVHVRFVCVQALIDTSSSEEDQEVLEQAYGLLQSLKVALERRFSGNIPKRKPWSVPEYMS